MWKFRFIAENTNATKNGLEPLHLVGTYRCASRGENHVTGSVGRFACQPCRLLPLQSLEEVLLLGLELVIRQRPAIFWIGQFATHGEDVFRLPSSASSLPG